MRLKKVKDIGTLEPGTRVLVTICIPEDNRNEMYTGTVFGELINYDDGKTDFKGILVPYMKNGYAKVYRLEV